MTNNQTLECLLYAEGALVLARKLNVDHEITWRLKITKEHLENDIKYKLRPPSKRRRPETD